MHASTILRRCLSSVLAPMHAARCRVLLLAVEALVAGRRLTLTDLARAWPGAVWMHAPLKALDRLLSNRHLQQEVRPLHQAMASWLLRSPWPVIVVDWSDLKADGHWCLLRAAVPMGGRTLHFPNPPIELAAGAEGVSQGIAPRVAQGRHAYPGHRCRVPQRLVPRGRGAGLALHRSRAQQHASV